VSFHAFTSALQPIPTPHCNMMTLPSWYRPGWISQATVLHVHRETARSWWPPGEDSQMIPCMHRTLSLCIWSCLCVCPSREKGGRGGREKSKSLACYSVASWWSHDYHIWSHDYHIQWLTITYGHMTTTYCHMTTTKEPLKSATDTWQRADSHSSLKVKYSVRCLHSWLPLNMKRVVG